MTQPITNTGCAVCDNKILFWGELCKDCHKHKENIDEIRRQKLRDKAFGNIWEEAGVKDV